jgi:hypothetical protein
MNECKTFDKDKNQENESNYLNWIKQHKDGFVLNTRSNDSPTYNVIHRARCSCVSSKAKNVPFGGFTQRSYKKICHERLDSLINNQLKGKDYQLCQKCNPK